MTRSRAPSSINLGGLPNEKLRVFRYWRSRSAGAAYGFFTFFAGGPTEFVGPEQPRRSAEVRSVRWYIGGPGNPQQCDYRSARWGHAPHQDLRNGLSPGP